jgi:hypothetical protein
MAGTGAESSFLQENKISKQKKIIVNGENFLKRFIGSIYF